MLSRMNRVSTLKLLFYRFGILLTVMRLFVCLAFPLLRTGGKDKTMKTPIEFDYDLWTTKDGKCMVRVKSTGETCEVSREAFRVLRAEEKRLRRSYTAAASDGDEAHPILSLNVLPEDSEKSPSWLTDHADFTDEVLTKMVIQEFRATLNSIHCAVFDQCLLGDKTIRAFAEEYGLRRSTVWNIANSLRKNFKKIM